MPMRKTPFSGKAKKLQLQRKKMGKNTNYLMTRKMKEDSEDDDSEFKDNKTHHFSHKGPSSRYALKLGRETDAEIKKKSEAARQAIEKLDVKCLEVDSDYYFPSGLDFPKRPPWNYEMSRQELDCVENRHFHDFLTRMNKKNAINEPIGMDRNIENWRQLWRVIEMSDILLFIVDIRFPNILFPPYFYTYIANDLNKGIIVILNKVDLASPPLVSAWKGYFCKNYPKLKVVLFTSFPTYNLRDSSGQTANRPLRKRGKLRMAAEGAQKLQEACQELVKDCLDISSWKEKIIEETNLEYDDVEIDRVILETSDTSYFEHQKCKEGILTIGCVGQPNVGKSSLINALMGRKVVSVSKTPGHTKHFQTIFLTENVRLCDCPGLVFPSCVPRSLQILIGSFPIAQVREPYTTIRYIAERLNLVQLLKITHPSNEEEWSAMDICEAWAIKRGFFTAKAARPDTYRAANHLLRMALVGQIALCFMPPAYIENEAHWNSCEDISYVKWIQARDKEDTKTVDPSDLEEDESSLSEGDEETSSDGDTSSKEGNPETSTSTKVKNRFDLLNLSSSD